MLYRLVVREKIRNFASERTEVLLSASAVLTTSVNKPIVVTPWLHFKMTLFNLLKGTILEGVVHNPLSPPFKSLSNRLLLLIKFYNHFYTTS